MDPKPRPNEALYIDILRRMTPEQRLRKTFELSTMVKEIFLQGLRRRHPNLGPAEFHQLMLDELARCHNQNY